jgi:NAD(P)-dependent dehydrogenase (short-subunit alcohol dehydrogenase family)
MPGLRIFFLLSCIFVCSTASLHAEDAQPHAGKAVLITGASSGIGRFAAEQLAASGYFVYAGARKNADLEALNQIENIQAIRLDVTKPDQIEAAVEKISSEKRGLWGLVNNAGVNVVDPLIEGRESDWEFLFDVNVFGVMRVTKAFAPLIIESKGRIVNISSISGILSGGPMIGYGPYSMSKHAVEAFSDQLESEMAQLGVKVSAVEPGSFRSKIGESRCKRMMAQAAEREYRYYAEYMKNFTDGCRKRLEENLQYGSEPKPVADAIEHALFADRPKSHYMVTSNEFESRITITKMFEELLHLNQQQDFSFTREQLLEIMDEEWAILKGEKERSWD